ncbi:histidinol phosphate phosphatase H [Atractiella rhizophila]|nr:histidinol phosphate phosphatase H [Atractiella rhizophila]
MPISHHSHSGQFCHHASGTLQDMIQSAIAKGFRTYGLSEHCPRYEKSDLYPEEEHLQVEQLEKLFDDYISKASSLKKEHEGRLSLLIGLETEYLRPASISSLLSLLSKHPSIDYLVGSVHHVNSIPIDFSQPLFSKALSSCGDSIPKLLETYFDHQYEIIDSLLPEIIGHFDVIRLFLPSEEKEVDWKEGEEYREVWKKVERNVERAIEYGALFEINTAGFAKWGKPWSSIGVIKLIIQKGGRLTLSDDSHSPDRVGQSYHLLKSWFAQAFHDQQQVDIWQLIPSSAPLFTTSAAAQGVDANQSRRSIGGKDGKREPWTRVRAEKVEGFWEDGFWDEAMDGRFWKPPNVDV